MNEEPAAMEGSTPRSAPESAPWQRIEVITRGARRRWSIDQKREIVAESLTPGTRPSEVIRKYGITSGQLYNWRGQIAARVGGDVSRGVAHFARVEVGTAVRREQALGLAIEAAPRSVRSGVMEIELPSGALVRVDADVDAGALRRVVGILSER